MPNQPPLNPNALEAAARATYEMRNPESWARTWDELEPEEREDEWVKPTRTSTLAYLAAALPEVTSVEQLTALSDKVVLEDRRGTIWQRINGKWYTPGSKHDYSDQSVMLPARVLYRPEVKP